MCKELDNNFSEGWGLKNMLRMYFANLSKAAWTQFDKKLVENSLQVLIVGILALQTSVTSKYSDLFACIYVLFGLLFLL